MSGPKITVCIRGPKHLPEGTQATSCFGDGEGGSSITSLPPCLGGGFSFEGAWGANEGAYVFQVSYPGYASAPVDGSTCSTAQNGCSGSFAAFLFPNDEPPDLRCSVPPGTPPAANAPPTSGGKPVNFITGNVWFDQTDVSMPGHGPGLHFTRSYNSALARRNVGGVFGRGWYHPFEQKLTFPEAARIKLRTGDGSPIWFEDTDSNGTFVGMLPRLESSWFTVAGGMYTRHFKGGGTETYDATGKFLSRTDASGNAVSLQYDSAGRLGTITESGGRALTLTYDAAGRIGTLAGPAGAIASYVYDALGRLQTVAYPDGTGFTFSYDSSGQIALVADASGGVVERHAYDGLGRGITSELADGVEKLTFYYMTGATLVLDGNGNVTEYEWTNLLGVTPRVTRITGPGCAGCSGGSPGRMGSWQYDEFGRIISHTDGLGKTWNFTYDGDGDLVGETDPLNNTTAYTHDSEGRVLTVTRPDGGITTYTHGSAGPLTVTEKVTTTQNRTTTLAYNTSGKLETITDPRSKVTTLAYNTNGDLTTATDPLSHATTFGYDTMGRRTTVTDALSNTTTTTYDARGRVTRVTNPDTTYTEFTYDTAGRRESMIDPLRRTTRYVYDDYGRLQTVTDPIGGTTTYGYDPMSSLTSLTDANGNRTAFAYDIYYRVSAVTYPGGAQETFTYDLGGHLNTKKDRKGTVTTYSYDVLGRLSGKTYSDTTPAVSYTYDVVGRLRTAANGTDTLTWTYDLSGQLLTEQSSKNSSTVSYTYDVGGNRLTVGLDGTLFVTYAYDDDARLTTITRGTNAFTFGYDNANRRTSLGYPNGVNTSYAYDTLSRLTSLSAVAAGPTTITSFAYTYDAAGNRLTKAQPDFTETYTYDPLYRLNDVARTGTLTGEWHYRYDPVGNRLSTQVNSAATTSSFNEKNQLLSATGGGPLRVRGILDEPGTAKVNGVPASMVSGNAFEATIQATTGTNTFSVEATDYSGNVTTKNYSVTATGSGATYTYDANGNLTQKVEGTTTWTYEWNAENQLTRVLQNAAEVARFKFDPQGRRVERVAGGVTTLWAYDDEDILRETVGASTTKYLHGPGIDEPLASEDGAGVLSHIHADGLGSIVRTTNGAGAVVGSRQYDSYGNIEVGAVDGYAFTGREWDAAANLAYYRARYYDPKIGRFISEDPIGFDGGDVNFYAYVLNNPVNLVDPTGEVWNFSQKFRDIVRPLIMAVKLLTGQPIQGPPPGMDQMGQPKFPTTQVKPTKPPVSGPPPGGGSTVIIMITPCLVAPSSYWINPDTGQCELRPVCNGA